MKSYWRKSREGETTQVKFKLNAVNDEAEVTCSGSVFQMRAPATGNAREPTEVSRTTGTIRSSVVEDLAWFQGAASRQGRGEKGAEEKRGKRDERSSTFFTI